MQRITDPTASNILPAFSSTGITGFFTSGDPAHGIPGTDLSPDFFNGVQEELINVIEAAGIVPSGTNNTQVLNAIIALCSVSAPTGTVNDFLLTQAPAGWIELTGTIGDAASGATYANANAYTLFSILWTQFTDAVMPLLTSAGAAVNRGASAASDWANNCRMSLPSQQGHFRRSHGGNGPAIGVEQLDALQNVTGNVGGTFGASSGPFSSGTHGNQGGYDGPGPAAGLQTAFDLSQAAGVRTANETRPISYGYLTCIKL